MQYSRRAIRGALLIGAASILGGPAASGQAPGLGGYGAMAGGAGSGSGMAAVAPFGGRFAASVPATLGGGGSVTFRPRPTAGMGGGRTAFTIGPAAGMAGGSGLGADRRPFQLREVGGGMAGTTMRRSGMAPATGMGIMPPSFASPFRQPPSLVPASSAGSGMSM